MPIVRDAEAWAFAFGRVDKPSSLPRGEIGSFAARGWHRLEILAALCPKRTLSKRWRHGPINMRYRYHQSTEDAGIGPRITAHDLQDPVCGYFAVESQRETITELVQFLACRFQEYADDESSTVWDMTLHPTHRPEWLVIAGTPGARIERNSRVHPDGDDGFAGAFGERDSMRFLPIQRAPEGTADRPIQAFCSMRFNAQGPQKEAGLLKGELFKHNVELNIIDVKPGQNITKIVFETMVRCDAFIAMATKDYGTHARTPCVRSIKLCLSD